MNVGFPSLHLEPALSLSAKNWHSPSAASRPGRPAPANAAVLESGRSAGASLSFDNPSRRGRAGAPVERTTRHTGAILENCSSVRRAGIAEIQVPSSARGHRRMEDVWKSSQLAARMSGSEHDAGCGDGGRHAFPQQVAFRKIFSRDRRRKPAQEHPKHKHE